MTKKSNIEKFENKKRLIELNPYETLIKLGLKDDCVFCDIGAGTGIFTFAASGITQKKIYATEISNEMIELLYKRKKEGKVHQLEIIQMKDAIIPIQYSSVDLILLSTVFHELEETEIMLKEIKRIKKENGKLAIIEFYKEETPMGPPINHRISKDRLREICINNGFTEIECFDLGENLYTIVFK